METPTDVSRPRPGVQEWTNPRNGFHVLELKYTADPGKRDPAWKAQAARGMHPRQFKREYEIDWASSEGEPVIPEFAEETHVQAVAVDPTLRLLRFWDFGFDSPVVLFAQLTLWDQLRVLRELCVFNVTIHDLVPAAEAIAKQLLGMDAFLGGMRATDFGGKTAADEPVPTALPLPFAAPPRGDPFAAERRVFDAGDPEGYSRKSLGMEAAVLARHGLRLHIARPGTGESYEALRARFLRRVMVPGVGQQPAIVIAPECRQLRQALGGAFARSTLPPYKPKKDHPFKDLVDALRYGNDNLDALKSTTQRDLRTAALRDVVETRL